MKSSGVICNAGFELPSEAVYLGKKLLVKPLKGQFEQVSNAMTLEMLKLGRTMETLDIDTVDDWLSARDGRPVNFPDVADHIAEWIMGGNWDDTKTLVKETWEASDSPPYPH